MKQKEQCSILLVTPEGEHTFNGDALELLDVVVSGQLRRLLIASVKVLGNNPQEAAVRVLTMYQAEYGRAGRVLRKRLNPAVAAGVEVDIIRCYLSDMTISGTVDWLRVNKGFTTSLSAIGRYWSSLRRLGIEQKPSAAST